MSAPDIVNSARAIPPRRKPAPMIDFLPTRRAALLAPLAGAACATPIARAPADAMFRNATTLSESVHSGVASADGSHRLTVRLCRYPEFGRAWIWMHARTPAGFFSYIDHLAPCDSGATPEGTSQAVYSDKEKTLVFERSGAIDRLARVAVSGRCRARRATACRFGPGDHEMTIAIDFAPSEAYSGLNAGRTEVFGHARAHVTIDGRETGIEGPAQFHEQRQTTPRFTQAFCYGTLWGTDGASTFLVTQKRREGYLFEGSRPTEIASIGLDPPAARRRLTIGLADGRTVQGTATRTQAYTIPIVGNVWHGHMVDVELAGRRYSGHINDYLAEVIPYAAPVRPS